MKGLPKAPPEGLAAAPMLKLAQNLQRLQGGSLLEYLHALGAFSGEAAQAHYAARGMGYLADPRPEPAALALLPAEWVQKWGVLPLALHAGTLQVAMLNPDDLTAQDALRQRLPGFDLAWFYTPATQWRQAVAQAYHQSESVDAVLRGAALGQASDGRIAVRLVDALLAEALSRGASDIHIGPEPAFVHIRYRLDGVLQQCHALPKALQAAVVNRVKVLAALDIAESRIAQDGRMTLTVLGRELDFRVSCQPTLHGENLVLRLLDRQRGLLPLEALGLTVANQRQLDMLLARPEGMLIVAGPTGSGKTTTLYSLLARINTPERNIMTLEDPVEYPLPLLRQSAVGESARMDFADGVRALLRQDPDVILVGEMRDPQTAEMAFRAALTGHQVFSTLHANSALGVLPRLRNLGVDADMLAAGLNGVISQRLLRRLCVHCRQIYIAEDIDIKDLQVNTSVSIYRASGCSHCHETGYYGRFVIMEILPVSGWLADALAAGQAMGHIQAELKRQGWQTLADAARRSVLAGETSLEEARRVVVLTTEPGA